MAQLIPALLPLSLLAFWLWMFVHMARSDDPPNCFLSVTGGRDPKSDWALAFAVLNIFTAVYYFVNVYRYRR